MTPPGPFHAGELALQDATGVTSRMERVGRRMIRDHLPEQHRAFYPQLPFLVVGAVDDRGDPWAGLWTGPPGFLASPSPAELVIRGPLPDDPVSRGLLPGAAVGLLGIELSTRRRNRLNGTLTRLGPDGATVRVRHAFGNCPRFIHPRTLVAREPEPGDAYTEESLTADLAAWIRGADTFFVASYVDLPDGERQVDVSHRGGEPGFVHISADGLLTIPDYAGNDLYNTLGNLVANPRAGLLFVDWRTGDVLQLVGDARVLLDSPRIEDFEGARRLWTVRPRRLLVRPGAVGLRMAPGA